MFEAPVFIYIAAPFTKPDPVENTHRVIHIADLLLPLGVVPIVPHLTMFWHLLRPRAYSEWLEYDLHLMGRCDAVLRVPGESNGADREVRAAVLQGRPVIHSASAAAEDCVSATEAWLAEVAGQRASPSSGCTNSYSGGDQPMPIPNATERNQTCT